jgi:hypothetical protein
VLGVVAEHQRLGEGVHAEDERLFGLAVAGQNRLQHAPGAMFEVIAALVESDEADVAALKEVGQAEECFFERETRRGLAALRYAAVVVPDADPLQQIPRLRVATTDLALAS